MGLRSLRMYGFSISDSLLEGVNPPTWRGGENEERGGGLGDMILQRELQMSGLSFSAADEKVH